MTMVKQLRLAAMLAPVLGTLAIALPAQAAPPSGGSGGHPGNSGGWGHGGFHHDHHDHFGFGFGFGGWDPWWAAGDGDGTPPIGVIRMPILTPTTIRLMSSRMRHRRPRRRRRLSRRQARRRSSTGITAIIRRATTRTSPSAVALGVK